MCGIIGYVGERSTTETLLAGLRSLEYRGYDSAGIAVANGTELKVLRSEGKLHNLTSQVRPGTMNGSYGIGHTRWATHGRPNEENAHPHRDCTGTIVVVHNGIVENYLDLKPRLAGEGHRFVTETDTEVIAHTIEKHFQGDLLLAVRQSLQELEGAFTFVALSTAVPGLLVGARNGPPLVVGLGEGESFLASDVPAFLSYTRSVIFLDDGDVATIRRDGVSVVDRDGQALERPAQRIDWDPVQVEKRGFKHFMLKEIFEQPRAVRDTLLGRYSLDSGRLHLSTNGLDADFLREARRIVVVACGTSWLAAQVGKFYLEELTGIPVDIDVASEFRYRPPLLGSRDLVVGVTQSGETADTLAALKRAKESGAHTLAISNVVGSMVSRLCHETLYTHAGPEIGVAATKTFTSQVLVLYLLALELAQKLSRLSPEAARGRLDDLARAPHLMELALELAPEIEALARDFYLAENFLFLGRGLLFPIALEGALKLKELSYIHAEGYPAGEMKHGPIALIDERMPVVVLAPANSLFEKIVNNIQEAKARGARILAVTTEGEDRLGQILDDDRDRVVKLPRHSEAVSPLICVIPLQLLAYYIALIRGCDVDQPRNLAKSVTVE
ncbi:MAG TPA: glutamine--fructose-6-phosphate transaminase (isomerizing) [Vicinamibacteria bacterium]|nr:glutamine--fructose-6-phosphate transaminase (isomerizing) [Vicinamibacteria bacterium]